MSKKHYIAMANAIMGVRQEIVAHEENETLKNGMLIGINRTVMELTKQLQIDNPAFNRAKFLQACGVSV